MTTRAATMATAIANRMRQIRDRSHPATRARSAARVTSRIYTLATIVYLDSQSFTAKFPDQSLLVVEPGGPAVPRGRAKADALVHARGLLAHSPTQLSPTPAITTPCGQSASELRPDASQPEADPRRS